MKYVLRNKRKGAAGKTGLPGVGFHLTKDGHYDLKNRKIVNIHPPVEETDGVNLDYIKQNCVLFDANSIDAKGARLLNLAYPQGYSDGVNLDYVQQNYFVKEGDSYNAKGARIKNLDLPKENSDCVNVEYLKNNCLVKVGNGFDATGLVLKNVKSPTENNDGINLEYFKNNCITKTNNAYDAKGLALKNIKLPTENSDGVSLEFVKQNCLTKTGSDFDAGNQRIVNLPEPQNHNDAINFGMLKSFIASRYIITTKEVVGEKTPIEMYPVYKKGRDFITVNGRLAVSTRKIDYMKMEFTFIVENPAPDETVTLKINKDLPKQFPAKVIFLEEFKVGIRTNISVSCANVEEAEVLTFWVTPKKKNLAYEMWIVFERVL